MADGIIVPAKQNPNVHAINNPPSAPVKKAGTPQAIQMVKPKKANTAEFREQRDNEKWSDYLKARATFNLTQDSKSGKLEYVPARKVLGFEVHGQRYVYHSDPKETLGDVKARYNLPDGSLKSQSRGGGGNFDRHDAPDMVIIEESDMEAALGKKLLHTRTED